MLSAGGFATGTWLTSRPVTTLARLDDATPAVLGHRGASAVVRENTVEAFRLTAELGGDGVELDVRRTGDGELIIHHNATLGGLGALVDQPLAAIRAAAPWMATYAEAMEACAGMLVNVEIKNFPAEPDYDPDDRVAQRVAEWVGTAERYDSILVSSFNPATVAAVRAADARIATGLLVHPDLDPRDGVAAAAAAGHRSVHPYHETLRDGVAADVVARARAAGLWVVVWTPEDPDELRTLAAAGVDAVIVDDPGAARRTLG